MRGPDVQANPASYPLDLRLVTFSFATAAQADDAAAALGATSAR